MPKSTPMHTQQVGNIKKLKKLIIGVLIEQANDNNNPVSQAFSKSDYLITCVGQKK
jgi:hypothetical protein